MVDLKNSNLVLTQQFTNGNTSKNKQIDNPEYGVETSDDEYYVTAYYRPKKLKNGPIANSSYLNVNDK